LRFIWFTVLDFSDVECGTIPLLNNDNIEGSLLKGILGLGLEAPLDNRISNYLTLIKCAEAQL
jgi:hypothetical protein